MVYNGQNGGDSWRNYTTERGQTARISARAKEMLAAPVNAALGKNKLFFGRDETGDSEYLGEFDGGAKMVRAQFLADSKGAPSPELARAVLLNRLRRKTAAAIFTANLQCLQNRMQHLGTGNQGQARRRREQSRRRFFLGGDASWASYRYREEHENYPHGQTGPW